jgi:small-conductance mechanosensitive channel
LLHNDRMGLQEFINYEILNIKGFILTPANILQVLLILVSTWVLLWFTHKFIKRRFTTSIYDVGRGEAFYQIVRYVVWILSVALMLDSIGVEITLLLAGSAALLVGLGFGIQQIFNDVVSGILLLFEGTVSVGDIVEIEHIVGKVQRIALRTSIIQTRDHISIIVPNSKLVSDNVINWTHNRSQTRFNIKIGVAYGSDVPLVMRLLEEAATAQKAVAKNPKPNARFIDFGDSALMFEILFWSDKMFEIEFIKSAIRVEIDALFRTNNVIIPFPQRDLHLKTVTTLPVNISDNSKV